MSGLAIAALVISVWSFGFNCGTAAAHRTERRIHEQRERR